MRNNLPTGTIIAFSAKLSFKHLFRKPLHYIIQMATGSRLHHVGIMCDGYLWEAMTTTGVRFIPLEDKLKEIDDCITVIAFEPVIKLNNSKISKLRLDLNGQHGKSYSALQAMYSAIDRFFFFNFFNIKPTSKKMFCSKLVMIAYAKLFPKKMLGVVPKEFSPEECKKIARSKKLVKAGKIIKKAK